MTRRASFLWGALGGATALAAAALVWFVAELQSRLEEEQHG